MKNLKQLAKVSKAPASGTQVGGSSVEETLKSLIQTESFLGWLFYIDYEKAYLLTNDTWKHAANGVPHNCFLVASSFTPENYGDSDPHEREVYLLRITGSSKLPQDDDLVKSRIDYFQKQKSLVEEKGFDPITLSQMQFGALECRVLGTFYAEDGQLCLGSDLESFPSASRLKAYRPTGKALELIVNYIDPIRRQKNIDESVELGMKSSALPFNIGTVRYTSTIHMRNQTAEKVQVKIQPADFLARRTAVLGMTRTGKSNMIKQLVSVVMKTSGESSTKIGQIIFDLNGEYANANRQDSGAIADVFTKDTIRYRLLPQEGFERLQNNFYEQLIDGHAMMADLVAEKKNSGGDLAVLLGLSFDQPPDNEWGLKERFAVRKAAYWGLLYQAGFKPNSRMKAKFKVKAGVRAKVNNELSSPLEPENGLSPAECRDWFIGLRKAWKAEAKARPPAPPNTVIEWLEDERDEIKALINLMAQKNEKDSYILGFRLLMEAASYHTPDRNAEVSNEIYEHLKSGKIVILDLSVGRPSLRNRITTRIAEKIFTASMDQFIEGKIPSNIVMYIEEAHNLIGKDAKLDEIWPRVAKEGAKYRISLVYATQEVSAMHPNILANTENWFITHLNNQKEIAELSKFYDFKDFAQSLMRAQDVGFARVKTLSSPYVIPVQIDKFDPSKLRKP